MLRRRVCPRCTRGGERGRGAGWVGGGFGVGGRAPGRGRWRRAAHPTQRPRRSQVFSNLLRKQEDGVHLAVAWLEQHPGTLLLLLRGYEQVPTLAPCTLRVGLVVAAAPSSSRSLPPLHGSPRSRSTVASCFASACATRSSAASCYRAAGSAPSTSSLATSSRPFSTSPPTRSRRSRTCSPSTDSSSRPF